MLSTSTPSFSYPFITTKGIGYVVSALVIVVIIVDIYAVTHPSVASTQQPNASRTSFLVQPILEICSVLTAIFAVAMTPTTSANMASSPASETTSKGTPATNLTAFTPKAAPSTVGRTANGNNRQRLTNIIVKGNDK